MNRIILALLTALFSTIMAMEEEVTLTIDEDGCFEWINNLNQECRQAFNALQRSDKEILYDPHADHQLVCMAINRYTKGIFKQLEEQDIHPPLPQFDQTFAANSMLKVRKMMIQSTLQLPIGPTTARLWIFNYSLTEQEHACLQKDNYCKNPEAGNTVWWRYARMVVDEIERVDKRKKVPCFRNYYRTTTAKATMIQQIAEQKIANTRRMYGLDMQSE